VGPHCVDVHRQRRGGRVGAVHGAAVRRNPADPFAIIGPLIVVVCFVGAWTVAGCRFDLWLALAFGFVGYVFKKADYPIAPLVPAMVVGDKAEDAFRQAMIMAKGSLAIFWSDALSGTLMTLALLLLFWPLLSRLLSRVRTA
jgi:putative tricarboxylic transport membrane protein